MSILWRDSGRTIRFLGIDGRVVIGLLAFLFHISLWTLGIALFLIIFFAILERMDYTVPNAFRAARSFLAGKKRHSSGYKRRNQYRSR